LKEASGLEDCAVVPLVAAGSGRDDGHDVSGSGRGRIGRATCKVEDARAGVLLAAFDIAAFKTWVNVGLMPHDRHGGKGVYVFAVPGSKLAGTGLEKLQIVHTQVVLASGGSTG
jgi:hypothetical protein